MANVQETVQSLACDFSACSSLALDAIKFYVKSFVENNGYWIMQGKM